ncbi:tyrosine-type recombinase/integrase [Paracidovorax wautersii]|uniref:Site-specific recombinase XerD n=1 Tax=Paracidovorax wautersii TaxID=1177982 RepID=A0A1I2GCB2_9BURK|nr:tyrosine-type recombinase/integrase [Paracidovorax wautersii]SFF15225.1 Site-specific recombinase XerD [Paracidovorax wautersii]
MGQKTPGIYAGKNGTWEVDKYWKGTRFRQRGLTSYEEAERWLIKQLSDKREVVLHGVRAERLFDAAAAHYLMTHRDKASIVTEAYLLQSIMPFIGHLTLPQIHDASLAPYVAARKGEGRANKTINLALGVVRRILNLAASAWRDEDGRTWLQHPPKITMLPLVGHQREPRPISWAEQRQLLPQLPDHLARMALFVLNTGVRDDVVCSLRWEWEIPVPELGVSVFDVPRAHVKGRRKNRLIVCNSVAQSVIEAARGQHPDFVFVYRRERVSKLDEEPAMAYRPIGTMNNTGWQNARKAAGLSDLHVHDLRHTLGMRLREAGVTEGTVSDVLWHSTKNVTQHYSMAQIVELHDALEKIKADTGAWNKTLTTLRAEHQARLAGASPPKVPQGLLERVA